MEELNKKVIGNAVAAYFMVFVSVFFLFSKKPYINHPFVKSHVKSAFSLHILMLVSLFIMSYPFLRSIDILGYSLNTIITASLSLLIFSGMLYGMFMAHNGKTVTLGEIFHKAGVSKDLMSTSRSEKISEEDSLHLILAHIPFLGYIIYPRHKDLNHMRDISQLNLIVTLLSTLIFIGGYTSLASLIMLAYIIYCVFQGIRLTIQDEISTLDLSVIPTVGEKYLLQKSLLSYVWNNLRKKNFIPLSKILEQKTISAQKQEKSDEIMITGKWGFHLKNTLVLGVLCITVILIFSWDSPILILFLFPICYSIGYISRRAYRMPYIYDIYAIIHSILYKLAHIFSRAKKLKNTTKKENIKMGEIKKDS